MAVPSVARWASGPVVMMAVWTGRPGLRSRSQLRWRVSWGVMVAASLVSMARMALGWSMMKSISWRPPWVRRW